MSLVTITASSGTVEVYEATIVRPLVGVWHADLDVDSSITLSGSVTISIADGALQLVGTVTAGASVAERQRVRVVGGSAGLAKALKAHAYDKAQLRVPLYDVLTASGERLATSSDSDVLSTVLPRWTRTAGPASHAMGQLLAKSPSTIWRMTASGAVWIGRNAWPTVSLDYVTIEDDPARRVMVIASDDPTLTAGVTLDGKRIEHVIHRYAPDSVRTEVWYS